MASLMGMNTVTCGTDGTNEATARQKSVPASLSVLEKSLGEHHDLLMQLSNILQGALSPERPRCPNEPKKTFANCPIADVVMRNVAGVEECSYLVRELLERLEV